MLQQIIFIAKKSTVGFPIFLSHANPDSLCSLIFFFSVGPIADHYFGELNITPMDGAPKYVKGKPTAVFSWLLVGGLFDPLCWCKSRPRCSSNIRANQFRCSTCYILGEIHVQPSSTGWEWPSSRDLCSNPSSLCHYVWVSVVPVWKPLKQSTSSGVCT